MISMVGFLLFLGLIVFGPKKTIEMAQQVGRIVAQVKHSAGAAGNPVNLRNIAGAD